MLSGLTFLKHKTISQPTFLFYWGWNRLWKQRSMTLKLKMIVLYLINVPHGDPYSSSVLTWLIFQVSWECTGRFKTVKSGKQVYAYNTKTFFSSRCPLVSGREFKQDWEVFNPSVVDNQALCFSLVLIGISIGCTSTAFQHSSIYQYFSQRFQSNLIMTPPWPITVAQGAIMVVLIHSDL